MSKLLLTALLLLVVTPAMAYPQDYPNPNRFTEYNVKGTSAYIIRDNQTGCEYLSAGGSAAYTLVQGSCTLTTEASK